jgi:hypothetical protein
VLEANYASCSPHFSSHPTDHCPLCRRGLPARTPHGPPARPLAAEFARYLSALPPHLRFGVLAAFVWLDQRARFYGPGHGRRFVALDPVRAEAQVRHLAADPRGGDHTLAQLLKRLVTLCYYELPAVQAAIGYQPDPYVIAVAARRRVTYGTAIRHAEAALAPIQRPAPHPDAHADGDQRGGLSSVGGHHRYPVTKLG